VYKRQAADRFIFVEFGITQTETHQIQSIGRSGYMVDILRFSF